MERKGPSRTAESIAIHRAMEAARPPEARVCDDPYARYFLSDRIVRLASCPFRRWMARRMAMWRFPGVNGAIVARVRFMDEILKSCLWEGIVQLVVLGAGYDTRAYRFEKLKNGIGVFEVDDPVTQERKKNILREIFKELPRHVKYVPMRFDEESLREKLSADGYAEDARTLFIWEGVAMYLSPAAVDETLSFVLFHSGPGSSIVFDYLPPGTIDGGCRRRESRSMRRYTRQAGEPLRFGIERADLSHFLTLRGFQLLRNAWAPDLREEYFSHRDRRRKISPIFSFAHAATR